MGKRNTRNKGRRGTTGILLIYSGSLNIEEGARTEGFRDYTIWGYGRHEAFISNLT